MDIEKEKLILCTSSMGQRILYATFSFTRLAVVFILCLGYSYYLEILHENYLWFSNIKQVEREISFRTEQGLYYSFYKTIVSSPSFVNGLQRLAFDNSTESGRVINTLSRFNIYQEVLLSFLYRSIFSGLVDPIYFYIRSVFMLSAIGLYMLFMSTYHVSKSWLLGLVTLVWFLINKSDSTRVYFTIPLRESFALPLLHIQTFLFVKYLPYTENEKSQKRKLLFFINVVTFLFTITWQFAQFVLLLEVISLFVITITGFMNAKKTLNLYLVVWTAIISAGFMQFGQKMLFGSLVVGFIPSAFLVLYAGLLFAKYISKFILIILEILCTFGLTLLINVIIKFTLNINEDEHVMNFMYTKFLMQKPKDFVTMLYMCNEGFQSIGWDLMERLSNNFLFPCYGATIFITYSIYIVASYRKFQKHSIKGSGKWDLFLNYCADWVECHPDVLYMTIFSSLLGIISLMAMRMKFIWVPSMCILAPLSISYVTNFFEYFWQEKLQIRNILFFLIVVCLLGMLVSKLFSIVTKEMDNLLEFWDPDTVQLMEWISTNTPSYAVFAGSMQLLAGVKLCTGRAITNHPHFENKWLRDRTLQVYQMYTRRSPAEVHKILTEVEATHIILEDSICLSPPKNGCSLPEILEHHTLNHPDRDAQNANDKQDSNLPLFCNQIQHMKPAYAKLFKPLLKNRTFRVYEVLKK